MKLCTSTSTNGIINTQVYTEKNYDIYNALLALCNHMQ